MDVTEKVLLLCRDQYWEIKAQCLIFATIVLNNFRQLSHLLSQKEDVKGAQGIQKSMSGKPGSSSGPNNADRNTIKKNLNLAVEIINKSFNLSSPKSIQKLGLFELQPLLNDYKVRHSNNNLLTYLSRSCMHHMSMFQFKSIQRSSRSYSQRSQ